MRLHIIIISIVMVATSCSQATPKSDLEIKKEITNLMIEFQDTLNFYGLTMAFYLSTEAPYQGIYDEKFYMQAINERRIDEGTDLLEYATDHLLKSNLFTQSYKEKIKANKETGLDFSFWKKYATIGSVLTDSEFGLDFRGPLFWDMETREDFEMGMIDHERFKNGFAPNPDSIMASYDISINEVYPHFIELTSPTTASYYVNYKLIKQAGKAPRFIMDFVYEEGIGWLINNMHFDDYNGNVLKEDKDFSEY